MAIATQPTIDTDTLRERMDQLQHQLATLQAELSALNGAEVNLKLNIHGASLPLFEALDGRVQTFDQRHDTRRLAFLTSTSGPSNAEITVFHFPEPA